jgi:flagellar basal-body rod protein FlgG
VGAGVKAGAVYRVGTQGALTRTDNQYDLAIDGRGYFQVLSPSGENVYTRAGNLAVNDQGQLVTQDGYQVQPAITIPGDAIKVSISKSGQVEVIQAGQTNPSIVGVLELATFVNDGGLKALGGNLMQETAASGAPTSGTPGSVGIGTLVQGWTEASNVDAVAEITALIVAQRAYEMNSKVISTADNMLATANQIKA